MALPQMSKHLTHRGNGTSANVRAVPKAFLHKRDRFWTNLHKNSANLHKNTATRKGTRASKFMKGSRHVRKAKDLDHPSPDATSSQMAASIRSWVQTSGETPWMEPVE